MGAAKVCHAIPDLTDSPSASILSFQSVLYIIVRIVFSEALNVYYLFIMSDLIKSVKAPH